MYDAARAIPRPVIAAVLVVVAVLGFMSGHRSSGHAEAVREVSIPGASLVYSPSSGWRPASAATPPQTLEMRQQLALAPGGDAAHAALVVGRLPARATALPAPFIAQIRQRAETQVVYLANAQAYRYTGVELAGSNLAFTLYAVPNATGHDTAVLCYAANAASREMRVCEGIAATLTSNLPEPGVGLTPDPPTARALDTAISTFDQLRASLRPRISPGARVADVRAFATRLATGAANAASAIAQVAVPPAATKAQALLTESLTQTAGAYSGLAASVATGGASEYALARSRVDAAETNVDAALANFALLGYEAT